MLPRDLQLDEGEGDYGPPDPDDDADFEHDGGAPARADPLESLANLIKKLEDLCSMSGPDIADLVFHLSVPQDGNVEGISVEDAVQVCRIVIHCAKPPHSS